ncbi:hypothetical protein CEXT_374181 [Caerostris extrusa]|uniref:Uncharacterized protein n=1 Tax=Caerostris extrusa TaxID=172846 RepID=A0AAV4Y4P0_CAEEX|nr:hypothetical protein CEXT_374181 [Caerostris extrusa]
MVWRIKAVFKAECGNKSMKSALRYKIPAEDFLILQDVTWKRSFKSSPPPKGYMRLDVRGGKKNPSAVSLTSQPLNIFWTVR